MPAKPERRLLVRRFVLERSEDVSGVSGTGDVAEGVVFGNGKVVIAWTRVPSSIDIYDSVEDLLAIHGHGGRTRIRWLDDDEPPRTDSGQ
jgi:hypothetical protein